VSGGSPGWWAGKSRQAARHLIARVTPAERAALEGWLTAPQLALFDRMHVADRRHGLDVVAWLRRDGIDDPDVLVAGLLHDAGKGDTGFIPRVIHSLAQAYGRRISALASRWPGLATPLERLRVHAERSAELARDAGCSDRTVELIRHQDDLTFGDPAARRLHLADEAS
jgi:hypothetical protein